MQTFVDACRIALREPDILGRCGGEEFAVALPNTGVEGARIIAERLRYQVEQIQVPLVQGGVFSFTVSVGVATASPTNAYWAGASLSSLMAGADAALYRSKANGRNRVTEADAPG